MLAPSTRIGRYEIKSSLGKGGMGSLYLARDPNTDRLVAVKLLAAHLDSDELKARFALEAKALASLNHQNIVDIYDSGQFKGAPFMVMEYVRGETLEEMIRRTAPLSLPRKLKLIAQLCAGLAHAHEAGVIHRDVKPANVMVEDRSQRVKIVDFGIARVTEGLTHYGRMTKVNMQIGTPGYMSPEQIEGSPIDHRSDLFAVGVVLYELLSNRTAFPGENTRQIERKVLKEQPPPLDSVIRDVDPGIQLAVERALQKDPADRFQSATEFAEALDALYERLAKADTGVRERVRPTPAGAKQSPAPVGKGSKAEVAFQRCRDADANGALEAAKRFAVEALVEDAGFAEARVYLKKVDPQRWVPPPPARQSPVPPTQVARGSASPSTEISATESSDATLVNTRSPVHGAWKSDPEAPAWDPDARTMVVKPARASPAGRPWGTSQGRSRSGVSVDPTLLAPGTAEPDWEGEEESSPHPETWDPYKETIIGPQTDSRPGRGSDGRRQVTPRRPFPWAMAGVVLGVGAVIAVAAAVTYYVLVRPAPGFRLIIEKPTNGTIRTEGLVCGSAGDACQATLTAESVVEFRAEPDEGYAFAGYFGDCAPNGWTRMTNARSCGVTFERVSVAAPPAAMVTLTITPATGGTVIAEGIKCGTLGKECTAQYPVNKVVTLTHLDDERFRFRGFTAGCSNGTVAMTGPVTCGARFEADKLGGTGTNTNTNPNTGSTSVAGSGGGRSGGTSAGSGSASTGTGDTAGATSTDPGNSPGTPTDGGKIGVTTPVTDVKAPKTEAEYEKEEKERVEAARKAAEEEARKQIDITLTAFRDAMEALDIKGMQRVYPSMPSGPYVTAFKSYETLAYSFNAPPKYKLLDPAAGRAELEVESKLATKMKVGGSNEGEFQENFTMFKSGDNWLIQARKPPVQKKKR